MSTVHVTTTKAKAWVSLLGAIVTALIASGLFPVSGNWYTALTALSIVATAVTTWVVPNKVIDATVSADSPAK